MSLFIHFQLLVKQPSLLFPTAVFTDISTLHRFSFSACIELVKEMTISSRQTLLATWKLLFSQTRTFVNFLAELRISRNQQGKHEMRDEVISSSGTEDMNTSGYDVSDIVDLEFQ